MRYEITSFTEMLSKCQCLFAENFGESGVGDHLHVVGDTYKALDMAKAGFGIAVYDGETPVAMAVILITPSLHSGEITAENDTIFVTKSRRSGSIPGRLFMLCEREAKKRGCTAFQWEAPIGSKFESTLLKRDAYRPIQTLFRKEL